MATNRPAGRWQGRASLFPVREDGWCSPLARHFNASASCLFRDQPSLCPCFTALGVPVGLLARAWLVRPVVAPAGAADDQAEILQLRLDAPSHQVLLGLGSRRLDIPPVARDAGADLLRHRQLLHPLRLLNVLIYRHRLVPPSRLGMPRYRKRIPREGQKVCTALHYRASSPPRSPVGPKRMPERKRRRRPGQRARNVGSFRKSNAWPRPIGSLMT